MIIYRLAVQGDGYPHRSGAIPGERHVAPLLEEIGLGPRSDQPGEIVIVDMAGIETVTGSYLKATFLRLLRRAGAPGSVLGESGAGGLGEGLLNIFPMVAGLSDEVRADLDDLLQLRKLCGLEVLETEGERVVRARLLGMREGAVVETLRIVVREGEATAARLLERYGGNINVTGWNNRLADLHRLRLARRRKEGRFWVYTPIAEQVVEVLIEEAVHG